ncbi:BTB/POZ domain [Carpediemonas membranifera]|uniref:BTB/POZ domain n=1 Tax=Carpediemonas membranifera TaxID=201153 RepID=A0A8J6ATC4_9EUKA|nr:BTB/POZ domain [Carpediemonas membranifera]|eukprot:KAG9390975.1 BTB/POZ domain [Carpediemonas membranifera]
MDLDPYLTRLGEILRIDDAIKLGKSIAQFTDIARITLSSDFNEDEAKTTLEQFANTNAVADVILHNLGQHLPVEKALGIGRMVSSLRNLAKLTITSPFSKPNTRALLSGLKTSSAMLDLTLTMEGPLSAEEVAQDGDVGRAILAVTSLERLTFSSKFGPGALVSLVDTLARSPSLVALDLADTSTRQIHADECTELSKALPGLGVTTLTIKALFQMGADVIFGPLLGQPCKLHSLEIGIGSIRKEEAARLGAVTAQCPSLQSLTLTAVFHPGATFALVDALRGQSLLSALYLRRSEITAIAVPEASSLGVALGHMPTLTRLDIESLFDERAIEAVLSGLRFCGSIRHLRIRRLYDERVLREDEGRSIGTLVASLSRLTSFVFVDGFDEPEAATALMQAVAASPALLAVDVLNDSGPLEHPAALADRIRNNEETAGHAHLQMSAMRQWLCSIMRSPATTDFTIAVADGLELAHLDLLASRSQYFQHLRRSTMRESFLRGVDWPDVTLDVLRPMLGFMYTGDSIHLLSELRKLTPATLRQVQELTRYLQLTDVQTVDTVLRWVAAGTTPTLRERRLLQKCGFRALYADLTAALFALRPRGWASSFFRGEPLKETDLTLPWRTLDDTPHSTLLMTSGDDDELTPVAVPSLVLGVLVTRPGVLLSVTDAMVYLAFCLGPRCWEEASVRVGTASHAAGFPEEVVDVAERLGHTPVLQWCARRLAVVWDALSEEERGLAAGLRARLNEYL